ncbi:VanZ family protein [Massilia sp. W12]|uniref:VanZ family protein n=1 Tax=Massilia sp. W12 TaxID=3126507 RepID=UPI0030CF14CF
MQAVQRHRPPPQASPMARIYLLLYLALIVYASLYPWSAWREPNAPLLSWLVWRMPRYWTWFDLLANIIAYMPLGTLGVFALYPRVQRWPALLLALALGALLSGGIESAQSWLPTRVPSILDWWANLAGSLLGAALGWWQTRAFLDHGYLHLMRKRWFIPSASRGLLAAGLWPLAQLQPQAYLFGHGQFMPVLSDLLSDLLDMPIDLLSFTPYGGQFDIAQYWLAETVMCACGLAGAVLSMSWLMRPAAPRWRLLALLLAACLGVKTFSSALVFTPEHALLWLTPGAQGGLLLGGLMLAGLLQTPPGVQRRLAALCLLLALATANLTPLNPYFSASLQTWAKGQFINFNGAAQILALSWPLLAVWCVWHPSHDAPPAPSTAPQDGAH